MDKENRDGFEMNAVAISKEIFISDIEKRVPYKVVSKTRSDAVLELGKDSYCFVYSFGSMVFFNIHEGQQLELLSKIRHNGSTLSKFETDRYTIVLDPQAQDFVDFNQVTLKKLSRSRLEVIAEVLAKSVSLETLEKSVDEKLKIIGKVNARLKEHSAFKMSDKRILSIIGDNNSVLQRMLTKLYVLDKPDVTWDDKALEGLFYNMRNMFELDTRFDTLKFKIDFVQKNMEMLMDLRGERKANLLELTIIGLIVVEILLFVYELWL